ncbi:MAG: ABC transporter ATP-binding protein [Deltaproteobacteria bacterium]|nr:ABC transporter ATP-binding protein [Deltaproteobacteria bacterium]
MTTKTDKEKLVPPKIIVKTEGLTIVKTEGLTKSYLQGDYTVHALRGVDLEIATGDFVVLAGPSGSGKTTLLNLIGALDTPTSGKITVDGERLDALTGRRQAALRLRRIGFVFQSYNLIPVLTAYENAEYVMLLQGVDAKTRSERVGSIFAAVGLSGMEDRRPAQLSGGQQQRVAVARAIVANPALILADEPTANLDSETGTELVELMLDLNAKRGITFIVSSHDDKVIKRGRRVVHLVDGALADEVESDA